MLKSFWWFPKVQWQTFQIQQLCIPTQCSVILACYWWYKLFVHWWMRGIYFTSFYFRVWDLTRENKTPAKISTYTVLWTYSSVSKFNQNTIMKWWTYFVCFKCDHIMITCYKLILACLKYNHNAIIILWNYSIISKWDQNTIIIWWTYFSLATIWPKDDHEIVNLF